MLSSACIDVARSLPSFLLWAYVVPTQIAEGMSLRPQ